MSKETYTKRSKNSVPVCILKSWLRAGGIQVSTPETPGHDLLVTKHDGSILKVVVSDDVGEHSADMRVSAKAFTGRRDDVAIAALLEVQVAAGYEPKRPDLRDKNVVRNEKGGVRKHIYRDEDFLVTIRHNELRRAPNPPPEVFQRYESTMREAVWSFMRALHGKSTCFDICARHGLEMNDLLTYARLYVVNFVGRYEIDNPIHSDNERLCYRYIKQRLHNDFLPVLLKKERSVLPDSQTAQIALLGCTHEGADTENKLKNGDKYGGTHKETTQAISLSPSVDPTDAYIAALDNPKAIALGRRMSSETLDEHEVERLDNFFVRMSASRPRNRVLDTSSVAARRKSATKMLGDMLGELPHERLVEVLGDTVRNLRLDQGARLEALRRLRAHRNECSSCEADSNITLLLSRRGSGTKTGAQAAAA